ncbi:glycosyltransferase family 4 protein [Echinicola shivajiensis]|uniref:glycosyltransferase family 4 protein n=1 Tax=Echinicola shivajiensis TaxID=1035916 RepID=UPI001BFC6CCE|nr:glycosyltransferase family 4 protein [Echinicola shivajiensis]
MGASSRLRTFQYLPLWEAAGFDCTVSSFFNKQYLEEHYAKRPIAKRNVLACYQRRWKILQKAGDYEYIIIEKELFPYIPFALEKWAFKQGPQYIFDYDDAVFHNYDLHGNPWIRSLLKDKIDQLMARADRLWLGNEYLATRAQKAGAKNIMDLPTVIDLNKYSPIPLKENQNLKIGWIGSPTTLKYLEKLKPVFEALKKEQSFTLNIIANGQGIGLNHFEETFQWSEEEEVKLIQQLDIGIMPLNDSPWEQGKCAYKLIQYMACGLPVIASPIGMNKEVVKHVENGFLASTSEEWIKYLSLLISDPELRRKMGTAGRKLVAEKYTLAHNWQKIQRQLNEECVMWNAES